MTQNITPMKRLSESLKQMEKLLYRKYARQMLNRKSEREYYDKSDHTVKKTNGVHFDTMYIYYPFDKINSFNRQERNSDSFAISFNYDGKEEAEIFFSFKINNEITYSKPHSLDETKTLLKNFKALILNYKQKHGELNQDAVLRMFRQCFIAKDDLNFDPKEAKKEATKQALSILKEIYDLEDKVQEINASDRSITAEIGTAISKTPDGKLLSKLETEREKIIKQLRLLDDEIGRVRQRVSQEKQILIEKSDTGKNKDRRTELNKKINTLRNDFKSFILRFGLDEWDIEQRLQTKIKSKQIKPSAQKRN